MANDQTDITLANETAIPCGCVDPACPVHTNEACPMPATGILYRVDMDDTTGTNMCDDCAEDALDSGVFTTGLPASSVDSCWGCGPDYLNDGVELTDITIYGVAEKVCPACYDELPEDYAT